MITIDLSPSQYRVVRSSSVVTVPVPVTVTARASRMSQFQAPVPSAKLTNTKRNNTTTNPIYGIVNLALLAVSIYLLWANFL